MWLTILSIAGSIVAIIVDESTYELLRLKHDYAEDNYWIWVSIALVCVAIAVAFVQLLSREAEGSGIPQVRAILCGVTLENMLSWKTFLAKLFGITAMLLSGLSTGKEGPFVHLVSCIADNLPYKAMRVNKSIRHQMIAAAIAVGVSATFGAPIGGVLFSIELSTNVYNIHNLWKALYSATISVVIFKAVWMYSKVKLFDASATQFYSGMAPVGLNHEIPFFLLLAILCACLGSFFILIVRHLATFKKRHSSRWFFNPWLYSLSIAFLVSTVQFLTKVTQAEDKIVLKHMIDIDMNLVRNN
jgi:chloride channel 2